MKSCFIAKDFMCKEYCIAKVLHFFVMISLNSFISEDYQSKCRNERICEKMIDLMEYDVPYTSMTSWIDSD